MPTPLTGRFGLLLSVLLATVGTGCVYGDASDTPYATPEHFDGTRFYNRDNSDKALSDVLRMLWDGLSEATPWPERVENPAPDRVYSRVHSGIRATYINHATVLLQVGGLNILTDPVYSARVSPVPFAGPKRVRDPGIALAALPPIDVILISHNHYDHLDTDSLKLIQDQQQEPPLVIAGLGNAALLSDIGMQRVIELDWDQHTTIGGLNVHFVECKHRSGRGLFDHMRTLWGSYVLDTPQGRIYFAGDTGYSPHFAEQGERWGPFELSVLPIGAYEPRWFMKDIHLNPEEAVQAHRDLNSRQSLAIHFGVFRLTYEGIDDPLTDLSSALRRHASTPTQFWVLEPGQARAIESVGSTTAVNHPL